MHKGIWAKQDSYGNKVLAVLFAEVVNKITQPFVTVVSEIMAPRASFLDGKVKLVGDALALLHSHKAMATNQVALHCQQLEKVLKGQMSLSKWESTVLQYVHVNRLKSIASANSLFIRICPFSTRYIAVSTGVHKIRG